MLRMIFNSRLKWSVRVSKWLISSSIIPPTGKHPPGQPDFPSGRRIFPRARPAARRSIPSQGGRSIRSDQISAYGNLAFKDTFRATVHFKSSLGLIRARRGAKLEGNEKKRKETESGTYARHFAFFQRGTGENMARRSASVR